ncbi:hypothetical protein RB195_018983 [Necator americanus]|uniref:Core-2/I-Branching enzyme n=1 Tax=Necator americanus TaxID=51031 RepID=A0ABR1CC24_NECAM
MEDCSVGYKTEISHYQREIATLRRHASLMHRRLEDTKRNVRNGVSAIAHVLNGNFSDTLRLQLKGVENLLSSLAAPRFKHRPETSHLDCGRLFSGDVIYTAEVAHSRIVMIENEDLDMSCDAIHSRIFLQPRVISSNYGIAFARIVHRDYEFLEEQLSLSYTAENHYCYHVDIKSDHMFKQRMLRLSECLPNVYLSEEVLDINGAMGTNVNFAHLSCLKLLEKKGQWTYAILQQTHDVVIHTNSELRMIFQALNGSNDVQITPCAPLHYDQSMSWDAESLGVFQGSQFRISQESSRIPLYIAKGAVQVSLSRAAVVWITNVNLGTFIRQLNSGKRAVDEMLMSTLQIADGWEMPGRFTDHCLKQGYSYEGITRMVQWSNDKADCLSGFLRHQVCILGIENLPSISTFPHILANKMMPSFDYGAIACLSELLFNRTYLGQNDHPLNISFYENLSAVRFHNDQRKHGIKPDCHNP